MKFHNALQTANMMGVTTRTLERWRSTGKFIPIMRTAGGHSRYSDEQIKLAQQGVFNDNLRELLG